jgi:hypothetical protein
LSSSLQDEEDEDEYEDLESDDEFGYYEDYE